MKGLEVRTIGPGEIAEIIRELDQRARAMANPETKYNFQVGIKDVEFSLDEKKAQMLGLSYPFKSTVEAERALQERVIAPTKLVEDDDTSHQVLKFDPSPVGYTGFDNCVIHSLAQTNRGLFEIGRYPAMDLDTQTKTWQWFIHRRIERPGQG